MTYQPPRQPPRPSFTPAPQQQGGYPQPGYAQPGYPQGGYPQQQWGAPPAHAAQEPPRKKRRFFLWFFLAVQAIFVIWLITAGTSVDHSVTHCVGQYCKGASEAGGAIGIGLVVVFWMVVDVILGISYGVYRLATRGR